MKEEKFKLDDFVMFDLKIEKLKDKHTFFYLTHNGKGLYYKAKAPAFSDKKYILCPQRHKEYGVLVYMSKNMDFETEIRDSRGRLIV